LESDHRGGTDPRAGGRHKEPPSRRKGGDVLLGYSGQTALRREQCDVPLESQDIGARIYDCSRDNRVAKHVSPTTNNNSWERCVTTEL
jgi:hypothetical protein